MARSTAALHNRFALAFDFDQTLGPPTYDRVLEHCGYDAEAFRREHVVPLVHDHAWENALADAYCLADAIRRDGRRCTEEDLAEVGRTHPLYPGVGERFGRVREAAQALVEDVNVRFALITARFAARGELGVQHLRGRLRVAPIDCPDGGERVASRIALRRLGQDQSFPRRPRQDSPRCTRPTPCAVQ